MKYYSKRGDFASIIFAVTLLFVIGIVFFFVNHLNQEIFTAMEDDLNDTYSDAEAMKALSSWKESDQSIWDYAFLGIFLGVLMALGLTAYAIRISPVFYWIYGFLSLFVLVAGVVLSNMWQRAVAIPEFTTTLTRFPITDALLGSYYPLIVVVIVIISMIIIFGKPVAREEGFI